MIKLCNKKINLRNKNNPSIIICKNCAYNICIYFKIPVKIIFRIQIKYQFLVFMNMKFNGETIITKSLKKN